MDDLVDNKLDVVTGGDSADGLEEFDWKTKGFVTPVKEGNEISLNNERLEVLEEREKEIKEKFTWQK